MRIRNLFFPIRSRLRGKKRRPSHLLVVSLSAADTLQMSKIPIAVANAASFFYPAEDGGGGGGGSSSGPVMGKTGELWSNITIT